MHNAPEIKTFTFYVVRHTSVSSTYPCQSVSPSVSPLVILLKLLESKGTVDGLSCCSELQESKEGNASGVVEGLNARVMYMKA